MHRRIKQWSVLLIPGVVLAAIIVYLVQPPVIPVETGTISSGPFQASVDEQGYTRARFLFTVAAPVTGSMMRTGFNEGDWVEQGTELTRIAPPPLDTRTLATARARLDGAMARQREVTAQLDEAGSNNNRATQEATRRTELFARGQISKETNEQYQLTAMAAAARLRSLQAALQAANADIAAARANLSELNTAAPDEQADSLPVLMPVSGRILRVHEESERVVASGTPLFDVSKGDELELVIDYLTQEAILIRPGNKVVVSDWGGATPLSGTVRYVEPGAFTKISTLGVEEQRVNVIVDLDAPPPELGAGFRITAAIVYWESDNLLKIPTSAIFRSNQMWHTFVVRDDEARLQALEIGHRNDDFAQLLSGVDNGDVVILYPSDLIEHGTLVSSGQ